MIPGDCGSIKFIGATLSTCLRQTRFYTDIINILKLSISQNNITRCNNNINNALNLRKKENE